MDTGMNGGMNGGMDSRMGSVINGETIHQSSRESGRESGAPHRGSAMADVTPKEMSVAPPSVTNNGRLPLEAAVPFRGKTNPRNGHQDHLYPLPLLQFETKSVSSV